MNDSLIKIILIQKYQSLCIIYFLLLQFYNQKQLISNIFRALMKQIDSAVEKFQQLKHKLQALTGSKIKSFSKEKYRRIYQHQQIQEQNYEHEHDKKEKSELKINKKMHKDTQSTPKQFKNTKNTSQLIQTAHHKKNKENNQQYGNEINNNYQNQNIKVNTIQVKKEPVKNKKTQASLKSSCQIKSKINNKTKSKDISSIVFFRNNKDLYKSIQTNLPIPLQGDKYINRVQSGRAERQRQKINMSYQVGNNSSVQNSNQRNNIKVTEERVRQKSISLNSFKAVGSRESSPQKQRVIDEIDKLIRIKNQLLCTMTLRPQKRCHKIINIENETAPSINFAEIQIFPKKTNKKIKVPNLFQLQFEGRRKRSHSKERVIKWK